MGQIDLLCTLMAAAGWYLRPGLGPWPLLLVAAGRLARFAAGGRPAFRPNAFDLPLLAFLASALIGALIAYDPHEAWTKFWHIAGGIALADSVAHSPLAVHMGHRQSSPLQAFLALTPALISAYFLLTNPWALYMGKVAWLNPVMRWFASWQLSLPGYRLNPNETGGIIAAYLPLQAAVLWPQALSAPHRARRPFVAALLSGISALGLLLTASRGAWIALALACLTWWLLGRLRTRDEAQGAGAVRAGALQVSLLALVGASVVVSAMPAALAGRLEIQRNSLDLVLDYPFTGLGLGGFPMAYSTYVLLLHVVYIVHSHNLYLDTWIEQGLLGLTALIWLVVVAGQAVARHVLQVPLAQLSGRTTSPSHRMPAFAALCLPAATALLVILLHGTIDDAFYGYGSQAILLMFVPAGVLAGVRLEDTADAGNRVVAAHPGRVVRLPVTAAMATIGVLAAALLLPSVRSAFQANLGALEQTRTELSVYRWPEWPIQDEVRRRTQVDLRPAIAHYQAALSLDPRNPAAHRRLGQIALALGETDTARAHLEAANAAAPYQRATRQLLGETYALAGDYPHAVALWQTVDTKAGQLDLRAAWYDHLGERDAALRISAAAALVRPQTSAAPAQR